MKTLLRNALARLGYEVRGTRYVARQLRDAQHVLQLTFDDVVCRRMVETGGPLRFIQVGAFDGISSDPLRKYIEHHGWRGLLVEPQSRAAARLRELYDGNEAIGVIQAAVDRTAGSATLFTVAGTGIEWAGGLATFDKSILLKHAASVPGLEASVHEESVPCVTFDALLDRFERTYGSGLDLLQIDAEGADLRLLEMFPFQRVKPSIVHWEIKHASTSERERCFDRLLALGYRIAPSGGEDMLAVLG